MSYSSKEQIECIVCMKPIDVGQMQRHLQIVHASEKENYKDIGYKYGIKGRTKKKIVEERLW